EVTGDLFLLRRALVGLLGVAVCHGAGGYILLMLYEACGNTIIEVTYGENVCVDDASQSGESVATFADADVAKAEIDLKVAELVAKTHQGTLSVLRRRTRNVPGTTLRLEIPLKTGFHSKMRPDHPIDPLSAVPPNQAA
ncbi:MAG: sensor histidine kinase, partial [Actinobacteria bacterium]|nr:sensor histidine kinase [Actinomycetota bacterium]